MKPYLLLCALCYTVLLILPLPFLPAGETEPPGGGNATTVTTGTGATVKQDSPA